MPFATGNLTAKFEADALVLSDGDPVTAWNDGVSGLIDLVDDAGSVIYHTNQTPSGLPALTLDGASTLATPAPILGSDLFADDESTVYIVSKRSSLSSTSGWYFWDPTDPAATNLFEFFLYLDGNFYHYQGNASGAGVESAAKPVDYDDAWHVTVLRRGGGGGGDPGTAGLIRVDNTELAKGDSQFSGNADSSQSQVFTMGIAEGGFFFLGQIAAMYFGSVADNDAAIDANVAYLTDKWITPAVVTRNSNLALLGVG